MEFIHHKSGLTVKILESRKNGTLVLKAYIVDPVTMRNLSTSPKTCTVQIPEDKEIKKLGLVNKACADWLKKSRPKAEKSAGNNTAPNLVLEIFNKLDFDSNYFKQRWNAASTRKQASVFFRRNTIPFIERYLDSPCTRADVEDLFYKWKDEAVQNGNSTLIESQLRRTVNTHLAEAAFIYAAMRALEPTLPAIDFSGFPIGRSIQSEKAKSLPETVRQGLTAYLEDHISSAPAEVRGTVLMFDAALRTAEAAGQLAKDILLYDRFGVVNVRFQEKNGERSEYLKTDAAYRNVTLSFWGKSMIERCNALIEETEAEKPVLTARKLRIWIQDALTACGLDEKYYQAARKLMDEEPDFRPDGTKETDIIAYILRKDRTSRWLNVCGLFCVDVDYLLGHKLELPGSQLPNFKTIEHHREIAALSENYVYSPQITAHPFFSPILLGKGAQAELGPAVGDSFRYSGPDKGKLKLVFHAREIGSIIEVRVPKGQVPKVQLHTLPRRDLRDQPILGAQPIRYIENYCGRRATDHGP